MSKRGLSSTNGLYSIMKFWNFSADLHSQATSESFGYIFNIFQELVWFQSILVLYLVISFVMPLLTATALAASISNNFINLVGPLDYCDDLIFKYSSTRINTVAGIMATLLTPEIWFLHCAGGANIMQTYWKSPKLDFLRWLGFIRQHEESL